MKRKLSNFRNDYDIFVAKLNPELSKLLESTCFGAENYDYIMAAATDNSGGFFIGGHTISKKFPTTGGALVRHSTAALPMGLS